MCMCLDILSFDFALDEFIYMSFIFPAWLCKVPVLVYWIADFKVKTQNI